MHTIAKLAPMSGAYARDRAATTTIAMQAMPPNGNR